MNNKIKIRISGNNIDKDIKRMIHQQKNIYHMKKNDNSIDIVMDYQDYEELRNSKKNKNIKVLERYGKEKYKYLFLKHYHLIIILGCGLLLNLILSNIIFNIEIDHQNKKMVKIIKEDLSKYGIKEYHWKINYKKREIIKKKILEKENDKLEWLEIEENGTRYIIKFEERKQRIENNLCQARHIIAKKKALLTDIQASSGEVVKKKNEWVDKGEVIISGLIYKNEKAVAKRCATGIVMGETWYKVTTIIPKTMEKEVKTNKNKIGISIHFFQKELNLGNPFRNFQKKEYNIIETNLVPISLSFTDYQKTQFVVKKNTITNIDKMALQIATLKIQKSLKNNEKVISKKVLKKEENNSKIIVEVFFKIKENITDYLDIEQIDLEKWNQKEE